MFDLAEEEDSKERKQMMKRIREAQAEQQREIQRRELLKKLLTPEAYERLANVRMANFELYSKLGDWIVALAQSNRVTSKITEAQLKSILEKLTTRREPNIEFKHK